MITAYFDGACEPFNPGGLATGGWHILPCEAVPDGLRGYKAYCKGSGATNNVAEYSAAIDCLRDIYRIGWRGKVLLHGDSQLVVNQYAGTYACRAPLLLPLLENLKKGASFFESVNLVWVPREQNTVADEMSKKAFHENRAKFSI